MRLKSGSSLVFLALVVALGTACTGRPIPMTAVPGSSMLIPFGGENVPMFSIFPRFDVGYTSDVTQQPFPDPDAFEHAVDGFDVQRGEMLFVLCPLGMNHCFPTDDFPSGQSDIALGVGMPTRYVTAVLPERSSPAGISGKINYVNDAPTYSATPLVAQYLALVDVPETVVPGMYAIVVLIRDEAGGDLRNAYSFGVTPFQGNVQVVDPALVGPGISTPFEKSPFVGSNADISPELKQLVPFPKLVLRYKTPTGGVPGNGPSAATFLLDYPSDKVQILSIHEEPHFGQRSMIRWRNTNGTYRMNADDDDFDCATENIFCDFLVPSVFPTLEDCLAAFCFPDQIEVHLVDPDRNTPQLAIVFRLRSAEMESIDPNAFSIVSQDVFDITGNPITDHQFEIDWIR